MKSRDTPLSELTLRKYERPYNIKGRELVSKLCLSVGLLQPGDSRDIVVDVLMSLLNNHKKNKNKALSSKEIEDAVISLRKKSKLKLYGIASSNIRRQIKRLRDLHLVEKVANNYRISENEKLSNIYKDKIENFMLGSIKERVSEYFNIVDNEFRKETAKREKTSKQNVPKSDSPQKIQENTETIVPKDQKTFKEF